MLPNGLAFSPDETVLYINDTPRRHIRAFDLLPNGTLAKQTDRVFADLTSSPVSRSRPSPRIARCPEQPYPIGFMRDD